VIGFGHIWDNQATFSKLENLSAIADKLQNRYFDFWQFNICSKYPTLDLSAFRESGYNPSSSKIAILVADL
jgi:hypothetical protein